MTGASPATVGAVVSAVAECSLAPLRSAAAGVRAVWTDYAGTTFLQPAVSERIV